MTAIEAMWKILEDMRAIEACDYYDMVQDWAIRLQAEIERMENEQRELADAAMRQEGE